MALLLDLKIEMLRKPVETRIYLDFDLQIESYYQGYHAEVLNSPAGPAAGDFRLPFSQLELEDILLQLGQTCYVEPEGLVATKEFGWQLFNAIFSGEIQRSLSLSINEAYRQGAGLRFRLFLDKAPELVDLPWEYLYYPAFNDFLGLLQQVALVRYLKMDEVVSSLSVEPPLRALVLISKPDQYPQFEVKKEWDELNEALSELQQAGLLTLERVEEATLAGLQKHLQKNDYHIFHYIGHGYYDVLLRDGVVVLENAEGQSHPVSGRELGQVLHEHSSLRLAILDACEAARTSRTDPYAATAQSLVQQGLPAVISMQFEIGDAAEAIQAEVLYSALAHGEGVDIALSKARQSVFAKGNDVEWGSSVLYLSSPNGRLFDLMPLNTEKQVANLYHKALVATEQEKWDTAVESLQTLLRLDPNQVEAQEKLKQIQQQQELDNLYTSGQNHSKAGRWGDAIAVLRQVQGIRSNYKEVETLLNSCEIEYERTRFTTLEQEAQLALYREEWDVAIEKLQSLLTLDPNQVEIAERLHQAQSHQQLTKLYATGQQYYEEYRWCEALEIFNQIQAIDSNYQNVRTLSGVCDEECRRIKITTLPQEAQAEIDRGNWTVAAQKLQQLLEIDPLQYEAQDKLSYVRQQQEVGKLYQAGYDSCKAERWEEALEYLQQVYDKAGNFRNVEAIISKVKAKIAGAIEEQPPQITSLYAEAQDAIEREKWAVAIEKFKTILNLDSSQIQAETKLNQARRQQEWATLYTTGYEYYTATRWQEALKCFRQLQKVADNYKDVATLIPEIETKLEETIIPTKSYLDFDLEIVPANQGYSLQVINAPVEPASSNFLIPFSPVELENLLFNLGRTRFVTNQELVPTREFGWKLFNAIFNGELLRCLSNSLTEAYRQGVGLRFRLILGKTPELVDLPWEYLYYPGMDNFMGLLQKTTLIRYIEVAERAKHLSIEPPLRLLVMISSPTDYPNFDVDLEWIRLYESLAEIQQEGLVFMERMERATLSELQHKLTLGEYHVFHYIGPAYFEPNLKTGVLVLEDEEGRSQLLSGPELGKLLHKHNTIRLVVLNINGAEGGRTSLADPFASTAQSLIHSGIPAVVSMQFEITNEALSAHTEAFYNTLTQGHGVDLALSEARQAAFSKGNDVEWASPVLYLSNPEGRIFEMAPLSIEQQVAVLSNKALAASQQKEWSLAVEQLKALVALDPSQSGIADSLIQARQQQDLSSFYASGYLAYDAKRWKKALEAFRQVEEIDSNYRDVGTLIPICETSAREEELVLLQQAAQVAFDHEDWYGAIEKLQNILVIDPFLIEITEKLSLAQRELDLIRLYTSGQDSYRSGQWHDALRAFYQTRNLDSSYKDVASLISRLEQIIEEEEAQSQATTLISEAQAALEQEDWVDANQKIQALQAMGPNYAGAASDLLEHYEQQQQLATLYITSYEHYKAARWEEALESLRQLQGMKSHYKDVDNLIYQIESGQAEVSKDQFSELYPDAPPYVLQSETEEEGVQMVDLGASDTAQFRPSPAQTSKQASQASNTSPSKNVRSHQKSNQPPSTPKEKKKFAEELPVRVLYCILIGWWVGLIWTIVASLVCLPIFSIETGITMLKRLPTLLTLRPVEPVPAAVPVAPKSKVTAPQHSFFFRFTYFILLGWWLSLIWNLIGYGMCFSRKTISNGFKRFNRLPQILTGPKDLGYLRLYVLMVIWGLVPLTVIIMMMVNMKK